MTPGLSTIGTVKSKPFQVLCWSSGIRAAAEGQDLATAAKGLTLEQLDFWLAKFIKRTCIHEAGILQAEIDRRDPRGARETLWQFVEEPTA